LNYVKIFQWVAVTIKTLTFPVSKKSSTLMIVTTYFLTVIEKAYYTILKEHS